MNVPASFRDFPWIAPWQAISDRGRDAYRLECRLELTPGHPLYGVDIVPVARRCDSDDILMALSHPQAELAVVHLTFIGAPETDVKWPATILYQDLQHWVRERMIPDLAQFELEGFREAA